MESKFSGFLGFVLQLGIVFLLSSSTARAADPPKGLNSTVCNNPARLVKILQNGVEDDALTGLTATFGSLLSTEADKGLKFPAVFSNPLNCCSISSPKVTGSILVAFRGDCDFTTKAEMAEKGGAFGLLVVNTDEEITEMGCSDKDKDLHITIPVVMISKSGGEVLKKLMSGGHSG